MVFPHQRQFTVVSVPVKDSNTVSLMTVIQQIIEPILFPVYGSIELDGCGLRADGSKVNPLYL